MLPGFFGGAEADTFVAVFDGHGGAEVANWLAGNFHRCAGRVVAECTALLLLA